MRPKLGRKEVKDRDKKGEPETSTGRADDRRTELDLDATPPPPAPPRAAPALKDPKKGS